MSSENKNGKVPLISKIAYGFGDVGCNLDRKSTRLNSSHYQQSRMPSSA